MELSGAGVGAETASISAPASSKIVRLREAPAPKNFYFSLMTMDIWTQQPSMNTNMSIYSGYSELLA